jgi:tRNA(fMet)-specific endonuclease VapC
LIVLDTNACIDYLNGVNEIREVLKSQGDLVHLTSISIYEVSIGLERTKRKISQKRFDEMNKVWLDFISGMEIYSLGYKEAMKAAQIFDSLESRGETIDDNDILICGIMLANGISKILTRNIKHFEKVEGMQVIRY